MAAIFWSLVQAAGAATEWAKIAERVGKMLRPWESMVPVLRGVLYVLNFGRREARVRKVWI